MPASAGTEVGLDVHQKPVGWARFGGVMLRRAARTQLDDALERAGRAGGGRGVSREGVFWGWGEAGAGPSLPDQARASCAPLWASRAPWCRGRWRSRRCGCGTRRCRARCARGWRRSWGRGTSATTRRRASGAAAASPISTCCASARATARTRPTRWWRRATRDEAQQVIYACSEEGVAVVPYGGGTSVVGGLEPLRGRYGALISLDLGPAGGARVLRRALAHRVAARRDAAAGGRPRARAPRLHARPHAPELRVGDGRRLRRDALGGPVLHGPRAHRGQRGRGALRHAGRASWPRWPCPGPRPGRR